MLFYFSVFHNGRPMYRFNHSEYSLDKYREFVVHLTGIEPENITVQLTDEDYIGKDFIIMDKIGYGNGTG